ncbi:RNA polymerase sigma factor [Brevibacillus ginsengisoli]|uniref:RNA polymerase sigma factor n=1 Tax=Brevibacillus ginsengisoli TaxID=363854 RepID=UPI003CF975BE
MNAREFFETYQMDVFRTCYYMLHDYQDAEDLCQDVFVKALQQDFDRIEKPKPWILSITMNMCRNYLKRKKRVLIMERLKQLIDPRHIEGQYEEKELKGEIQQLLTELPEPIRSVILLKYLHQLKNEEVATILKIPLGTVKSRCNKGLQQLRRKTESTLHEIVKEGLL